MITVAAGVTIGLFGSQVIGWCFILYSLMPKLLINILSVYLFGTRKNVAHFAF
jgi:hypothetical protein